METGGGENERMKSGASDTKAGLVEEVFTLAATGNKCAR